MGEPIIVQLSYRDMSMAWHIAGLQTLKAIKWATEGRNGQRYGGKFGANVIDERADFGGALGEIALSKAFNLWWTAPLDVGTGDVGDLIESRAAWKRPRWGLRITKEDKPELPFVCVDLSCLPTVSIVGWDYARECKRDEWWGDPTGRGGAYWKPTDQLRDCAELRLLCHRLLAGEITTLEAPP
jgi:hypothetical protein